jgi:TolA-binding protein
MFKQLSCLKLIAGLLASLTLSAAIAAAEVPSGAPQPQASTPVGAAAQTADQRITELGHEVEELKALVHQLQAQISKEPAAPVANTTVSSGQAPATGGIVSSGTAAPATGDSGSTAAAPPKVAADLLRGMTINAMLDGYYEYNINAPIGRVNNLRAYDVSSNNFSLNQADLVVESAADPTTDKRVGMRIDLQYGQATSTLQGNPANELRPDVYRSIFQAYGTYVFPIGKGLTVDFGKWASSLGIEGNYTKDQLNYSRSYWFNYLPFYHTGIRAKYVVNDQLAINAWITNGTQQTEAFNNYKDQLYGFVLTPTPAVTWTFNYYQGQEHPDVIYLQNPGPGQQNLPNQQGTYILPIANPPDGKLQITDSYLTWQVSKSITFAAEADYVQQRLYSYSTPQHVTGGALYGGYQLTPKVALATRVEYLADVGGLFSGTPQYLKEGTLTFDYRPVDGFLVRGEYRRDQSNQHYFLGNTLGVLEASQPTIGFGLVWWFGQKEGAW